MAGDLDLAWRGGLNAGAALEVGIGGDFALHAAVGYHRPRIDRLARPAAGDAELTVYTGMLGLKLRVPAEGVPISPYLLGSAGVYRAEATGQAPFFDDEDEAAAPERTTSAALFGGFGLEMPVGRWVGLFVDIGYLMAFAPGDWSHRYQPIRVGVAVGGVR